MRSVARTFSVLVALLGLMAIIAIVENSPPSRSTSAVQSSPATSPAPAGWSQAMSVEDFLLDLRQLSGTVVSVRGMALCMCSEFCYLYQGATNLMQNTTFDPKGLNRETRKRLMSCSALLHYCDVVVTGRVDAKAIISPLTAVTVEW